MAVSVVEATQALRPVLVADVQLFMVFHFNCGPFPCEDGQVLSLEKEHSFHFGEFSPENLSLALDHAKPQEVRDFVNSEFLLRF